MTSTEAETVAAVAEAPTGLTSAELQSKVHAIDLAKAFRTALRKNPKLAAVSETPGTSKRGRDGKPNLGRYRIPLRGQPPE